MILVPGGRAPGPSHPLLQSLALRTLTTCTLQMPACRQAPAWMLKQHLAQAAALVLQRGSLLTTATTAALMQAGSGCAVCLVSAFKAEDTLWLRKQQ